MAALLIAGVEHPHFDPAPYIRRLDDIGLAAKHHISCCRGEGCGAARARVSALNAYLFTELGFCGNQQHYDDPRNSFLHEVLDRQVGIPVTLSVLYMEVARRAGLAVQGLNFPGHFLVRPVYGAGERDDDRFVIDPFHGGTALTFDECVRLLPDGMAADGLIERALRSPATPRQILARMLHNLKRIYVRMRSFPQARTITDMLLAVDPTAIVELRDRGLLAYHLNDFSAALHDLQQYLASPLNDCLDKAGREEHDRVLEHVKVLRRRAAELN